MPHSPAYGCSRPGGCSSPQLPVTFPSPSAFSPLFTLEELSPLLAGCSEIPHVVEAGIHKLLRHFRGRACYQIMSLVTALHTHPCKVTGELEMTPPNQGPTPLSPLPFQFVASPIPDHPVPHTHTKLRKILQVVNSTSVSVEIN